MRNVDCKPSTIIGESVNCLVDLMTTLDEEGSELALKRLDRFIKRGGRIMGSDELRRFIASEPEPPTQPEPESQDAIQVMDDDGMPLVISEAVRCPHCGGASHKTRNSKARTDGFRVKYQTCISCKKSLSGLRNEVYHTTKHIGTVGEYENEECDVFN